MSCLGYNLHAFIHKNPCVHIALQPTKFELTTAELIFHYQMKDFKVLADAAAAATTMIADEKYKLEAHNK